ncbi:hypothetical protein [Streptomyces sp. NPDC088752]|uniref:hypothetical protein n=1 Tax=Streptomyces sp. NPDC088752 TaxID=3154963 RepID=UPI00342F8F72
MTEWGEGENLAASLGFGEHVNPAMQDHDFCVRALLDPDEMPDTLCGLVTPEDGPARRGGAWSP